MNLVHLHLLLNHIPVIGMVIGLGLFVLALIQRSDDLKRASLLLFLGLALLAIPTYMSGNGAEETICVVPGATPNGPCTDRSVSRAAIETHNDTALAAFTVLEFVGMFAWLGLWQYRRLSRPTEGNLAVVLVLSVITVGLMVAAGNTGGAIRHPEMGAAMSSPTPWITASAVQKFVLSQPWMWPTCETLHFIGLSLLFGIVLVVDLRMMGLIKHVSFAALHRLLPWAILGFAINLLTGMAFYIASHDSNHYTTSVTFQWKMVLVLIAGANALYFTVFDEPWELGPGDDAPLMAKAMAASAVLLWIGIMFCGSMLPFLGNSF